MWNCNQITLQISTFTNSISNLPMVSKHKNTYKVSVIKQNSEIPRKNRCTPSFTDWIVSRLFWASYTDSFLVLAIAPFFGRETVIFFGRETFWSRKWGDTERIKQEGRKLPRFLYKLHSHPNGFYCGHQCSWTLTPDNSMQVPIMHSSNCNRK